MATQQDFEDLERAYYRLLAQAAPPPRKKGGTVDWIVNILFIALVAMALGIGAQLVGWLPPPRTQTDATAQPTTRPQAVDGGAAPAPIVVQPQPAPVSIEAPVVVSAAPVVDAAPTAFIALPAAVPVEQVTVVPRGMPALQDTRPTLAPTLTYPTPLPAALAMPNVSADGRCIQAERDGKTYQACQDWKYTPAEAASVADYLRTGLVPGDEVK